MDGNRALNFSSASTNQPINPGPLASGTSAGLGFGTVSNFMVSLWFKQKAMMATGANIGPRLFVLGAPGTTAPVDSGSEGTIGLKFQTANQLYFQVGGITASASFPANLPTNTWVFIAAVYDGISLKLYQGTDTNPVTLMSNTALSGNIDFGDSSALYSAIVRSSAFFQRLD